jgi:hypothetical protein
MQLRTHQNDLTTNRKMASLLYIINAPTVKVISRLFKKTKTKKETNNPEMFN